MSPATAAESPVSPNVTVINRTVSDFETLIALWAENELGPSKSARPEDLSTGEVMYGPTYGEQALAFLQSLRHFWVLRPSLYERYILKIPLDPAHAASLDPWEIEVGQQLRAFPLALDPRETEAEYLARLRREAERAKALIDMRLQPTHRDRKPVGAKSDGKSLRDLAPKRGRAA